MTVPATVGAIIIVAFTACDRRTAPHAARIPSPDTASIALYNRGTQLLKHDSLSAALPWLDSALATGDSTDSTVMFRSNFNSGWDHLMSSIRMYLALHMGGTTGTDVRSRRRPASQPSRQALRTVAASSMQDHVDSAIRKFRNALIANPGDSDAKWNYELALRYAAMLHGAGEKDNKRSKQQSKRQQRQNQQKVPMKQLDKQWKRPRLSPPEAEQILNAMEQHEQTAAKAVRVPATPPPRGKDW